MTDLEIFTTQCLNNKIFSVLKSTCYMTKKQCMWMVNSKYLGIDCFKSSFNGLMLFDQLHSSLGSDSTQRIAVITAQQNA